MSFEPTKLFCDSFFPNTETSLTMGNGHTQFAGLSDMTYSWVVDTSDNLILNGQASGPSPAIQPIIISSNGTVSIPSFDVSGVSSSIITGNPNASINATTGVVNINTPTTIVSGNLDCSNNITANGFYNEGTNATYFFEDRTTADYYGLYGSGSTVHLQGNGATDLFTVDTSGNANVLKNLNVGGAISATSGIVSSLTAGTNITLTGTATNPIINASGAGSAPLVGQVDLSGNGQYTLALSGVLATSVVICSYTFNVVSPTSVCWANPSTNQIDFTGTPSAQLFYAVFQR